MSPDDKNLFDSVFPEPDSAEDDAQTPEPATGEPDKNDEPADVVEVTATSETPEPAAPDEAAESGDDEDTVVLPKKPGDEVTPPRIVAETPIGGVPKHAAPVPPSAAEPAPDEPPVEPVNTEASTIPGSIRVSEIRAAIEDESETPESPAEPELAEAPVAEVEAEPEPEPSAEPVRTSEPVEEPKKPAVPPSRVTVSETTPADWDDDDMSPELAAILFAAGDDESAAAPPAETSAPAETEAVAAPPAPTEIEVEPPAEPIAITDVADVQRLRLTAEGRSAPAPDARLEGKVRYVRVEEPYKDDKGQRTAESWEYFKPNYPALEGRLVKKVEIEEIAYADGSWSWQYERDYDDRGRDRRTVRANADRTYFERADEISKKDPEGDKFVKLKEEVALIFAPPVKEEKGGFLSKLFGSDDEYKDAPPLWRPATSSEERSARKEGGEAF